LRRKIFPYFEAPEESRLLEKVLAALQTSREAVQGNQALNIAYRLGMKIFDGDKTIDTLLNFGEALFEVLDTEGVILHVTEREFCVLKRGAAVSCWLRKKKMHKPPTIGWDKMLEEFFSQLTGQQERITWS
jgi:hypothetical protein